MLAGGTDWAANNGQAVCTLAWALAVLGAPPRGTSCAPV
jgi:hypothetical protein